MSKITDITILHESVISLRTQLHNQLRQLILSGRWPKGTRIPSESQLTSHLKISRSTVRLALQQAEVEGLIERNAGRGTFVSYVNRTRTPSRLIAFVTCDSDADSQLLLLTGAESQAKAHGYRIVFASAENYHEQLDLLGQLHDDGVAGALLWSSPDFSQSPAENRARYERTGMPIVAIDRAIEGLDCDCVTSDNYGGARGLMHHLIEQGHRSIAFMSHTKTQITTIQDRYRAYCDSLHECGVEPLAPWLIGTPEHEIGMIQALHESSDPNGLAIPQIITYLQDIPERPTAILTITDYIAIIAIKACKVLNLEVPDDISIVGFDDADVALQLETPLTTAAQDYFTMGSQATKLLVERLGGFNGPPQTIYIPTELRIRSSTRDIQPMKGGDGIQQ